MRSGTWVSLRFMRWFAFQLGCVVVYSMASGSTAYADSTDQAVRELMVSQSIAAYPGSCPCPYNVDRAGRKCGARSAYSKRGGYAPLCFADDVTDEMIAKYRASRP